jgi:hypothetical protein
MLLRIIIWRVKKRRAQRSPQSEAEAAATPSAN